MKRTLLTFTAITSLLLPLATPVVAAAQDSAVQRRVERAQRQLDRDTAREQRSEPRREQPRREQPRQERPRQEGQRPQARPQPTAQQTQQPRRPDARPQDQRNTRPQYRTDDRSGQRQQYRPQERRNDSPVQRRVEEAQRQLDRANGVRPNVQRDRDNRRWDSNQNRRPQYNQQQRRDSYRDFQRRWNTQQWRRDFERNRRADWWRSDNRFRGWSGVRVGFYFAPGYGYYSVPRSYWNRHWQVGQFLPDVFWRYQVADYRTYGLGYPPPGTRWVYVDNSIYLIDEYDGYIVEVIRDAWRW